MSISQVDDARGEAADKEARFGIVRWHSLKVVPLSCVREKARIALDHLPARCKCEWDRLEHSVELVEVAESQETLEERLAMKEKNGSVLYIPEHSCWEEKGKIRKRPHSTDSLPDAKRMPNGTEGIATLTTATQGMVVNVGYGGPTKAAIMQGGMTKVDPMVMYPSFSVTHAETTSKNHIKDVTSSTTDAQLDSLKKRLSTTHGQLEVERETKKELSRTVVKLRNELGMVKAHLADYKQRLEALQAFPKPAEEDLQFLQDLLDYFYTQREHKVETVATPTQVLQSTAATVTDGLSHTKGEGGNYSQAGVPLTTTAMVISDPNGMGAPMNNVRTQVTGITGKEQLMDVCGVVFRTIDQEPHSATSNSSHPERHIYSGPLSGVGGGAITHVVGSSAPIPITATALPQGVILTSTIPPSPHVHPISVVHMPINSPGSGSGSSREGEMDEEGGVLRGSSEMGGLSGDISSPYGRNGYTGLVTEDEKEQEEEALKPGPNKVELITNSGVYIKVSDLKAIEQTPKESPTALMRSLISIWYSGRLLASCSATKGINPDIKNTVFEYVRSVFPDAEYTALQRALTSKCCEERRKIKKEFTVITSSPSPLSYDTKPSM